MQSDVAFGKRTLTTTKQLPGTSMLLDNFQIARQRRKECEALCERTEGCDGVTWNKSNEKKWGHGCLMKAFMFKDTMPKLHNHGTAMRMCPKAYHVTVHKNKHRVECLKMASRWREWHLKLCGVCSGV